MGKWEAYEEGDNWSCSKFDGNDRVIDTLSENYTKDTATRYALALNIVDAGVDLGDIGKHINAISHYKFSLDDDFETQDERRQMEADCKLAFDYLRAIEQAVEGDTTKEDGNGKS